MAIRRRTGLIAVGIAALLLLTLISLSPLSLTLIATGPG